MFKLLFSYVRQHKWTYLLVALTLIIYDATLVMPTKIIQGLMDHLANQTLTLTGLWQAVGLLVGVTLLTYVTSYIWHLKLFQQSVHFKFDMQQTAFKKLVFMRQPFYEKFRSGDMMTRFSTDVEYLSELVGYGMMIILYAGGMIAFIIPTMLLISWPIALAGLLPILLMVVGTYQVSKRHDDLIEESREALSRLNDEVLETVEGIRVIRAYSQKAQLAGRFREKTADLSQRWDAVAKYRALYMPMYSIMLGLATLLIIGTGLHFLQRGQVTLGQVIALQLYVVSLVEPFSMLSDFIMVYQTGRTSFAKLQALIETGDDMEVDGTLEVATFSEVKWEAYSFTYPQADRASLLDISLTLAAGQTLGIVGKTGSGKTSLVRQLLRQYPVGTGTFELNGQPITAYQRKAVEDLIGYVPQEHLLFSKSVSENIALGKQEASPADIAQAIETAAFTEDLDRMVDGLDTAIGERGVSISGGQKQRISIARAFIRNPQLLILDDALSAVDARTERKIIENIQRERAGKTNIIVTHRLSAVQHADWVIVMDEGRIVEAGTPAQLLAQGGWYYAQYQRQQSQEEEG